MENIKKILELDISDKKKAKLIESYLNKLEYPVVTTTGQGYYDSTSQWNRDPTKITYGSITCESIYASGANNQ